jgi:OHCU decarboxylase
MTALAELNVLPVHEFVLKLGGVFEHSPWVAQRVAPARPCDSRLRLLDAMRAVVDEATADEQLALIRAHPKLGLRGRERAGLTAASALEQQGAGLEASLPEDFARLDALNAAYVEKFAIPFILAVRGHTPKSIIAACERRLGNDWPAEKLTALREIGLIAGYRLAEMISSPV